MVAKDAKLAKRTKKNLLTLQYLKKVIVNRDNNNINYLTPCIIFSIGFMSANNINELMPARPTKM